MAAKKTKDGWRQGKWTLEEEQYVELLIEEFKLGTLPLAEGTTLRYFLSEMINCNPKRVSKKYENTNYNGKQKYEPLSSAMSFEETKRRRERLKEFERRYLVASKRAAEEQNFEEYQLQNCVDEIRARTVEVTSDAFPVGLDNFQSRLTAEIKSRMNMSNQYPGSSTTVNLSLTGSRQAKGVSCSGDTSIPHFGGSKNLDYTGTYYGTSYQQNNRFASASSLSSMPGHLASLRGFEDPLAWQIRSQHEAAQRLSAANRFISESHSMGSSNSNLPVSCSVQGSNEDDTNRLRSLRAGSGVCDSTSLNFASVEHRNRSVAELRHDVLHNDLASRHQQILRSQREPAGIMSNLDMLDSLKRGQDDTMDSFRPHKRSR